jgi:putative transposase
MQALGSYYVRYINTAYERTGTLWEGRFRATLVTTETHFLRVSRYIELNPLRAKMVDNPADYPWCSYHQNALGKKIALIKPHDIYLALGKSETERRKAYRQLFNIPLTKEQIDEIRTCTNKGTKLGNWGQSIMAKVP